MSDYKTIPLTQGKVAIVDAEDYERVNRFKWYAHTNGRYGYYARRSICSSGLQTRVYMAAFVLNAPRGTQIDHINRNSLDNRKSNLRTCTNSENGANRVFPRSKTGFRGVCQRKDRPGYTAHVYVRMRDIYIGSFKSPVDAARAYDEAAIKYHGEFAVLNFPKVEAA